MSNQNHQLVLCRRLINSCPSGDGANPLVLRGIADLVNGPLQNPEFYFYRGVTWMDKKEYDKAISDFSMTIQLSPTCAPAFLNRGVAWLEKKEWAKAMKDYNESIRLDPGDPFAYDGRGKTWAAMKEYDKAIQDYSYAVRLDPRYAAAFNNRGLVWLDKKNFHNAVSDFSEAIRLNPGSSIYYHNHGLAWLNLQDYDKAIEELDKAIRLNPTDPHLYKHLSLAWSNKTRHAAAISDSKEASCTGTRSPLKWRKSGDSFCYAGNVWLVLSTFTKETSKEYEEKAIAEFKRAVFLFKEANRPTQEEITRPVKTPDNLDTSAFLALPVETLNLSRRTRRCITKLGIRVLSDLVSHTAEELLDTKNFGITCLAEVREALWKFGLGLPNR